MNRAYEVLKDEDQRKKYDKYGEKGLDEQQGRQYESWNYYRYDFGQLFTSIVVPKRCLIVPLQHASQKIIRSIYFVDFYE